MCSLVVPRDPKKFFFDQNLDPKNSAILGPWPGHGLTRSQEGV